MEDRTIEYLEGKRARESNNVFVKYVEGMKRQEAMQKATAGLTTEELEALTPDLCRAVPKILEALEDLFIEFQSWTSSYEGANLDRIRGEVEEALALAKSVLEEK